MDFENNPQYQRMVQKMMRYSPHQHAVLSTALADEEFANQETKKMFGLAQMGAQKQLRARSVAFQEEKTRTARKQVDRANVLNLLGVGLSAKTAYDTNKVAGLKAKRTMQIAERYRD